jgi:hypothetical protein
MESFPTTGNIGCPVRRLVASSSRVHHTPDFSLDFQDLGLGSSNFCFLNKIRVALHAAVHWSPQ